MTSKFACLDFAPEWFTATWCDWHRGHGCQLDDGKPMSEHGRDLIQWRRGIFRETPDECEAVKA